MAMPGAEAARPPFLRRGRMHEVWGGGARSFALMVARAAGRPVLWIAPRPLLDSLHGDGLAVFGPLPEMTFLACSTPRDSQWSAEEALRAPVALTVVVEGAPPPALTPGRRLQLAAEAGGGLGLMLVSGEPGEGQGATAAETRWLCEPVAPDRPAMDPTPVSSAAQPQTSLPDSTLWRWRLIKNKSGTLGCWTVSGDAEAHPFDMAAKAGNGSAVAGDPGQPGRPAPTLCPDP